MLKNNKYTQFNDEIPLPITPIPNPPNNNTKVWLSKTKTITPLLKWLYLKNKNNF